jgi:hypothetical protein
MIKKTSCPYTQKKYPPEKQKSPPEHQIKKTKKNEKNPKEPEKNSEVQSFFDFKNGKIKKRIKTKIKSQDYETFFLSLQTFCFTSCI